MRPESAGEPLQLRCCKNPECRRKVKKNVTSPFCCAPCERASGRYELDDQPNTNPWFRHTEPCDERRTQRGEYEFLEAAIGRC